MKNVMGLGNFRGPVGKTTKADGKIMYSMEKGH